MLCYGQVVAVRAEKTGFEDVACRVESGLRGPVHGESRWAVWSIDVLGLARLPVVRDIRLRGAAQEDGPRRQRRRWRRWYVGS